MAETLLLVLVVVMALAFDFTNGFHDTANAMAASVASGALKPRVAVLLSAALNVVGAFLSLSVAATIAKGIVEAGSITLVTVMAGLIGAILWNLLTWLFGIPSSSSHALIGGVVGATLVAAGTGAIVVEGLIRKVLLPAVLAPVVALVIATSVAAVVVRVTRWRSGRSSGRALRVGQVGAASLVSLAHGTNDAQKTMGIITLALITHGSLSADGKTPGWVIVSCAMAMGLGTAMGGWRIMRTLGKGLTELGPPQGFSADCTTSTVVLLSSHFGFPLSTTHVVTGSVLGTGCGTRVAGQRTPLRWSVAGRMVVAWGVTLPAAGAIAAMAWLLFSLVGGSAGALMVFGLTVAAAGGIWLLSRRSRVHAGNVTEEWTGPVAVPVAAPTYLPGLPDAVTMASPEEQRAVPSAPVAVA
ncbi:MAG: inorganic phosphate transporter [Actinomycetales bacterium]|nr:inorganic phosphate transporter [Actinomycetales bacterium]